jgi:hypothetical protein
MARHLTHRKDSNHDAVCNVFQRRGLLVLSLVNLGGGAPDVLVLNPYTKQCRLIEIKTPKGALREKQNKFRGDGWPVDVVRDEQTANRIASELIGA